MGATQTTPNILVVDDDPSLRGLMAMTLQKQKYNVSQAEHGLRATEIMGEKDVDLVVLDLMMPIMDGRQFLHWLRNEHKSNVPVLVVTAYGSPTDENDELFQNGVNGVFAKPVNVGEFMGKVKEALA